MALGLNAPAAQYSELQQYIINRVVSLNCSLENVTDLSASKYIRYHQAREELIVIAEKFLNMDRDYLLKLKKIY